MYLLLIFFIFVPLLAACKKDNFHLNKKVCNVSLGSHINGMQKIANGCDESYENSVTKSSTVFVWNGTGSCSGVVISEHFILTAAHCFYNQKESSEIIDNNIRIIIGDNAYDLLNLKSIKIREIFIHPLYKDSQFYGASLGDIALIHTNGDLIKDFGLVAVKTTLNDAIETEEVLNVGYGVVGKYETDTGGLKRWSISGIGKIQVSQKFKSLYAYKYNTIRKLDINEKYAIEPQDSLLVTEKIASYHGQTCYGDSGGPQFVRRNGEMTLISITHGVNYLLQGKESQDIIKFQDDCNLLSTSLNTKIAPYYDWINEKIFVFGEKLISID